MATAIWGVMSPEKSRASLPAAGSYLESEEKAMKAKMDLGLDPLIERAQAWNDASDRMPIVRAVGDVVHIYTPSKDGKRHVFALSSVDVRGLIRRLEDANQSIRVRTANLMAREVG